jgi:hypothetical protein
MGTSNYLFYDENKDKTNKKIQLGGEKQKQKQ